MVIEIRGVGWVCVLNQREDGIGNKVHRGKTIRIQPGCCLQAKVRGP